MPIISFESPQKFGMVYLVPSQEPNRLKILHLFSTYLVKMTLLALVASLRVKKVLTLITIDTFCRLDAIVS